eukprot:COSAG02_NODE_707_length_18254_cov_20.685872_3_plen_43_part_00
MQDCKIDCMVEKVEKVDKGQGTVVGTLSEKSVIRLFEKLLGD